MASELDYSHTAAGILGSHRESMLQNQLLLRPQLGRPLKRGYSLPGGHFTYGRPNKGTDGGTAVAMGNWYTIEDRQRETLQLRGKPRPDGDMDSLPPRTAPELSRAGTTKDQKRGQKSRRIPPTMVFGISTRPSTPVFDLLEHKYQDRWLDERRNAEINKILKEQSKKNTSGKVYETRACLMRTYQNPVEQTSPLWQLPKFTRHATPKLRTFRNDGSRSAAYRHHESDSISRRGVIGHGVYGSAAN